MNNFIHAIDGFRQLKVFNTDTDSIYIRRKDLDLLDKAGCIGKGNGQGKNDLDYTIECAQYLGMEDELDNDKIQKAFIKKYPNANIDNFKLMGSTLNYNTNNTCIQYRAIGPKQKICVVQDIYTGIIKTKITFKGIPQRFYNDNGESTQLTSIANIDYFDRVLDRQLMITNYMKQYNLYDVDELIKLLGKNNDLPQMI